MTTATQIATPGALDGDRQEAQREIRGAMGSALTSARAFGQLRQLVIGPGLLIVIAYLLSPTPATPVPTRWPTPQVLVSWIQDYLHGRGWVAYAATYVAVVFLSLGVVRVWRRASSAYRIGRYTTIRLRAGYRIGSEVDIPLQDWTDVPALVPMGSLWLCAALLACAPAAPSLVCIALVSIAAVEISDRASCAIALYTGHRTGLRDRTKGGVLRLDAASTRSSLVEALLRELAAMRRAR